MYRPGHTGVSLLVYAPLGYVLLREGYPLLAVLGGVLTVSLAMVPDLDFRIPGATHRGITHTLLFAFCVGAAFGGAGWVIADWLSGLSVSANGTSLRVRRFSPIGLGTFGFVIGTLTIGAHLLADVITPMGIKPFWPLSSKRYSLGLVKASNDAANVVLLVLGLGATLYVLWLIGSPV